MEFPLTGSYHTLISDILDIISDAIIVIDSENRIVFSSRKAATMFRTSVEELKTGRVEDLFVPEDREVMVPNILKSTKKIGEFETETMLLRTDGTRFLGLLSSAYLCWENERGIVLTVHDITRMKDLERMLKRSERIAFLGHMLDDISHQIRNPVVVIGGFARRLSDLDSPKKKYAEAILAESARLELLLDTLNAFVKIPRPRLKPRRFQEVIEALGPPLEETARAQGGELTIEYPDDVTGAAVALDVSLLTQALQELVRNACEAYPEEYEEKPVTLRLEQTDRSEHPYAIKIIDRGAGITPEDLARVNNHFFSTKTKNIGLGLSIATRIIEEQQGIIHIESRKSQGTCISLYLIKERRRPIRTEVL